MHVYGSAIWLVRRINIKKWSPPVSMIDLLFYPCVIPSPCVSMANSLLGTLLDFCYIFTYLSRCLSIYPFLPHLFWWLPSLLAAAPRMERVMISLCLRCWNSKDKADGSPDVSWDQGQQVGASHPSVSLAFARFLWLVNTPAQSRVLKEHVAFSAWEVAQLNWLRSHMWALWAEPGTCIRPVAKTWLTAASLTFA